jgi:hypothetical protein
MTLGAGANEIVLLTASSECLLDGGESPGTEFVHRSPGVEVENELRHGTSVSIICWIKPMFCPVEIGGEDFFDVYPLTRSNGRYL